jgi:transcription elongation factor Elf1
MSRNNLDRMGASDKNTDAPKADILQFVTPTEFVELPSRGLAYKDGHPLHDKEVIEIRYMTAKDEDILTSQSLLKKGLAVDRFLQNILVDKSIDVRELVVGDRNAIIVAARCSGYGNTYDTQVSCPACGEKNNMSFDLENKKITEPFISEELGITKTDKGTFNVTMPMSKYKVEIKLLTGKDELYLSKLTASKKKNKVQESAMTDQYKLMILSVEGHSARTIIDQYVDLMPTRDSRYLRKVYKAVSPNIEIKQAFTCGSCEHEQELEVPFGADFFWPER